MIKYLILIAAVLSVFAVVSANGDAPTFQPVTDVTPRLGTVVQDKNATGEAIYLVRLEEAPLATYAGNIDGFEATSAKVRGQARLDVNAPASIAYRDYLLEQQGRVLDAAAAVLGRELDVSYQYYAAYNGFAARMTPDEAAIVAGLPGVAHVRRDALRQLETDYGPAWIGAPAYWNGTITGSSVRGEGVVVGVIDTGINLDHPSFAEVGPVDGYVHTNPLGSGNYLGLCDSDPGTWVCNDKLIGYYIFTGETHEDWDGHGSHTASTSAGNYVTATMDITITNPFLYEPLISGVAPHANIIAYDACNDTGGCPFSALVAAIDQTVVDNVVDVINYSIGGGSSDPWTDDDSLAFLAALEAGIVPVTSAGNNGPGAGTVGSPADAPWMLAAAASTHNRDASNAVINMTGGTPPADLVGAGLGAGYSGEIVYAAEAGDAQCLNPFPAGTWSGEIVVCDRGTIARVAKGWNVMQGGAGGLVLANTDADGESIVADPHVIPGVHIGDAAGDLLRAWLDPLTTQTAEIQGTVFNLDPSNGDIMAGFSSRGPNINTTPSTIKPNVSAPGVSILAAYRSGSGPAGDTEPWMDEFNFVSGTSMASPHTAGAAALLRDAYPSWTAAEIMSALQLTADPSAMLKEDGSTPADPFDYGSGRVDLAVDGGPGLVMDETATNFTNADPALGGDPRTLNLPQLGNAACVGTCSWTRTLRNTLGVNVTWNASLDLPVGATGSVTPSSFDLAADQTATITVTVNVAALPQGDWVFGSLLLQEATPAGANGFLAGDLHMPIAVIPTKGDVPSLVEIITRRDAGSRVLQDLTAIEITDLTIETFGLAMPSEFDFSLNEDPTNGDPYDDLNDVFYTLVTVPAGAQRLVAEILASTAPDADLYWGYDTNGNGMPDASEELGSSTTGSWDEYLNANQPPAGDYWILVQNWAAGAAPPDDITLAVGVVTADAGNMMVDGPTSVPGGEPFDLTVYFDGMAPENTTWYGAFSIGSNVEGPGDVGFVDVNLYRVADDVTKEASVMTTTVGSTVMYTITVQPNLTDHDLAYVLTDTVPASMNIVSGTVSASAGTVAVNGNVITWNGTMATPVGAEGDYVVTTSANDASCDTGFGGYVNLADFGIFADSGVTGDTQVWTAFSSGDPINYYTTDYTGLGFTDDGFAIADPANNYGGAPWVVQSIPDPAQPNNVLAILWQDFELFYDQANNHGVSLATAGSPGGVVIVEYDDVQFYGGSQDTFDFEVVMARAVDNAPGAYEIVYAYDNLNGDLTGAYTIGVENSDGSKAQALVNAASADGVISNGFMVCMDYVGPSFDPVTITYEATATACPEMVTNVAESMVDEPGAAPQTADASVYVTCPTDVGMTGFAGQANGGNTLAIALVALVSVMLGGLLLVQRRRSA